MDLDDVALDGAAAVFVWRGPGKSDAALGLVLHYRTTRGAGGIWSELVHISLHRVAVFTTREPLSFKCL